MLGTPILVGAVVFAIDRRWVRYAAALCWLMIVWLLARPYLDWAHGN